MTLTMTNLEKAMGVMLVAVAVGSVMTWATGSSEVNDVVIGGLDDNGAITAGVALAATALIAVGRSLWTLIVPTILALALFTHAAAGLADPGRITAGEPFVIETSPGIGLWLMAAASALAFVFGLVELVDDDTDELGRATDI